MDSVPEDVPPPDVHVTPAAILGLGFTESTSSQQKARSKSVSFNSENENAISGFFPSPSPAVRPTSTVAGLGSAASTLTDASRSTARTHPKLRKYDIFLSHLQRNGQDAVISMDMLLKKEQPGLKTFLDLEVDMHGDLSGTLQESVRTCSAFLFFITDGVLQSEWCARELRWAVEYEKTIVLVRETDPRHGGIDMKEFFAQVPHDLMPVFRNTIAIPWYREPAFRKVSLTSILHAANIEDKYQSDMSLLTQKVDELAQIVVAGLGSGNSACFEVIQEYSMAMRIVFWMGGFKRFENPHLDMLYTVIFNMSFWFCGVMCAANLLHQTTPYHTLTIDMLTAYVHLPAWQSWYTWRRFVLSEAADDLLNKARRRSYLQAQIARYCRIGGRLILFMQVVMICDVLAAFALPGTLHGGGSSGTLAGGWLDRLGLQFTSTHSAVMWIVAPPVIAAMFASYSMFAFVALLHIMDIVQLREQILDCISVLGGFYIANKRPFASSFYPNPDDSASEEGLGDGTSSMVTLRTSELKRELQKPDMTAICSDRSAGARPSISPHVSEHGMSAAAGEMQAEVRYYVMEEGLFTQACNLLTGLFDDVQKRVNVTCQALSGLWVHLIIFACWQMLAVMRSVEDHLRGTHQEEYEWWWYMQDFFHLGGGLILLIAAMGFFCSVTMRLQSVPVYALDLLRKARCPPARQAVIVSLITAQPLGMHILWGSVCIDLPKVCGFFFLVLALLAHSALAIASLS